MHPTHLAVLTENTHTPISSSCYLLHSCASFSPNLSALDLHLNIKCQSVILLFSEISTVRSTRKRKVESIAFKQTDLARIMIRLQLKYQWLSFHITHHCFFLSHLNKGDVARRSPPFSISTQLHLCPGIFLKRAFLNGKAKKHLNPFGSPLCWRNLSAFSM